MGCITVYQEYSSPPEVRAYGSHFFLYFHGLTSRCRRIYSDCGTGGRGFRGDDHHRYGCWRYCCACAVSQLFLQLTPAPQVTELAKDDISAQVRNPAVAQDFSDPTTDKSNWCLLSPGVNKDAYIQHSGSSDVTAAPLVPTENGLAFSDLESPMDVQHDSELETESGRGCDTTHRTLMETFSLLHYVIAFSHLSCLRHASPPTVLDSACSEIDHAPSSSQAGISASYGDDSPNELSNSSSLLMESASAAFVRPTSPLPPSSPGFINDYSTECPGYASISPLPSQHSPVPSSSPPDFFTSSPTRHDMYKSPPTSPGSAEKLTVAHSTVVSPNPLKRPYSPENDHNEGSGEQPAKKKARHIRDTRICDTHTVSRN